MFLRNKLKNQSNLNGNNNGKKKPPPRPPPPNLTKYRSKSIHNLHQPQNQVVDNLIELDWSPPHSPQVDTKGNNYGAFGGSVSSSFSSSTSSLASSKKSFECENSTFWPQLPPPSAIIKPTAGQQSNILRNNQSATSNSQKSCQSVFYQSQSGPTIIRGQPLKKNRNKIEVTEAPPFSPPMPCIPPPSPPKEVGEVETPYGIALYDFPATSPEDLPLSTNDVVLLIKRINADWLYGKVLDREGMFPAKFVDIQVPLPNDNYVTALYDFRPETPDDLQLKAGQIVLVTRKISEDWLYGQSNGQFGQFPSNFVDRIPKNL